jgi:hypothetical protein
MLDVFPVLCILAYFSAYNIALNGFDKISQGEGLVFFSIHPGITAYNGN